MNRRDLELLSSYLDGQLKPFESARLEARLSTEPDLRAVLDDLRSARGLLRQLPMRRAPRNFTLTPRMVGRNPPLPRSYPAFRFMTALASLLLFFTMGLNFLAPQLASPGPALGMGGGGAPEVFSAQAPAATEASGLATEAPVEEAPAPAEPAIEMAPMPTATAPAADTARQEDAFENNVVTEEAGAAPVQAAQQARRPVPPAWQLVLAGIAVLGVLAMWMMRQIAASRWRQRQ